MLNYPCNNNYFVSSLILATWYKPTQYPMLVLNCHTNYSWYMIWLVPISHNISRLHRKEFHFLIKRKWLLLPTVKAAIAWWCKATNTWSNFCLPALTRNTRSSYDTNPRVAICAFFFIDMGGQGSLKWVNKLICINLPGFFSVRTEMCFKKLAYITSKLGFAPIFVEGPGINIHVVLYKLGFRLSPRHFSPFWRGQKTNIFIDYFWGFRGTFSFFGNGRESSVWTSWLLSFRRHRVVFCGAEVCPEGPSSRNFEALV